MKCFARFLVLILLGCSLPAMHGQTDRKEALEQRKIRLMDEIELANRILAETQKDRKASLGNIETVQQKIKLRSRLIRTLDREIELLEEQEAELNQSIDTLSAEVERQKEAYAEMIRQANRSKDRTNRLMFILSARDFNQAVRRLEYLKQISAARKRQIEEIQRNQVDLSDKANDLRIQKVRKEALRGQLNREKQRLSDERLNQEEAIAEYQSMEQELADKLEKKQAEAQKVEREIQRIIAAEIKRAKAAAERNQLEQEAMKWGLVRGRDFSSNSSNQKLRELIAARKKAAEDETETVTDSYELTPEARQLAANFAANQKRLPWPVQRGLVVSEFGPQRHPVVKSVIIENKGIDIATERGSQVRAIFKGKVSSVILMPDGYRAIIINHGEYFTVYQNLTAVKVTSGQEVDKGQVLGEIAVNPVSSESRLHFEIWKNNEVMNPLGWLASKP